MITVIFNVSSVGPDGSFTSGHTYKIEKAVAQPLLNAGYCKAVEPEKKSNTAKLKK